MAANEEGLRTRVLEGGRRRVVPLHRSRGCHTCVARDALDGSRVALIARERALYSRRVVAAANVGREPSRLGRYEVVGRIGQGGMATVYLGRLRADADFERIVAIKCCDRLRSEDDQFSVAFLDEARLAARIHHPNVVQTWDVGSDGPFLYFVMELVEGESLSELARAAQKEQAPFPIAIAVRVMVDALRGLHAAHELCDTNGRPLRVVHRDVSPQNVMVGADGVARIMDFGVARAEAKRAVTREGVVKGKFAYMAPEQLLDLEIDRRSDVFAAGVVLWELLTARRLFAADSLEATIHRVLHAPIDPPSDHRPDARALDDVIARALDRDPTQRFSSAEELADALERVVPELAKPAAVAEWVRARSDSGERLRALLRGASAPAIAPAQERTSPARSRRVPLALAAIGILGLGLGVGVAVTIAASPAEVPRSLEPASPIASDHGGELEPDRVSRLAAPPIAPAPAAERVEAEPAAPVEVNETRPTRIRRRARPVQVRQEEEEIPPM
jgi:eukaryotic-like serine/threonine-protein kinase